MARAGLEPEVDVARGSMTEKVHELIDAEQLEELGPLEHGGRDFT